jgi:hypothetical protein
MIFEVLLLRQIPPPSAVMIAPAVTLTWEVNPLGMTKLIAHERKVTMIAQ